MNDLLVLESHIKEVSTDVDLHGRRVIFHSALSNDTIEVVYQVENTVEVDPSRLPTDTTVLLVLKVFEIFPFSLKLHLFNLDKRKRGFFFQCLFLLTKPIYLRSFITTCHVKPTPTPSCQGKMRFSIILFYLENLIKDQVRDQFIRTLPLILKVSPSFATHETIYTLTVRARVRSEAVPSMAEDPVRTDRPTSEDGNQSTMKKRNDASVDYRSTRLRK